MNTREQILVAADRVFGEVGFESASTREIAESCGVNKSLIHYHFGNKESLFASVLDAYYERLRTVLLTALEQEGSFKDRIVRLADAYIDFLASNRGFSRIVQRESSGGKNVAGIVERMSPIFRSATELLQKARPSTVAGDLAAEQVFVSVYGMIVTYFTYSDVLRSLLDSDPYSNEQLAKRKQHIRRMVELLVAALDEEDNDG